MFGIPCQGKTKEECQESSTCVWTPGWLWGGSCNPRKTESVTKAMVDLCMRSTREQLIEFARRLKAPESTFIDLPKPELCHRLVDMIAILNERMGRSANSILKLLDITSFEYTRAVIETKKDYDRGYDLSKIVESLSSIFTRIDKNASLSLATIFALLIAAPIATMQFKQSCVFGESSTQLIDAPRVVENIQIEPIALDLLSRQLPKEYNLTIVAGSDGKLTNDDLRRAIDIADKLKAGFDKEADVCKLNEPVCRGNLGIERKDMPQIMDRSPNEMLRKANSNLDEYIRLARRLKIRMSKVSEEGERKGMENELKRLSGKMRLEEENIRRANEVINNGGDPNVIPKETWMKNLVDRGYKILKGQHVKVSDLRASQAEILADKTYGIANAFLKGDFPDLLDGEIMISRERAETRTIHTVIDGHHRFSSLLTADPDAMMAVTIIDCPLGSGIRDVLEIGMGTAGVFREDLQGKIVPKDHPLDMGRYPGEIWKQLNGKWYGKRLDGVLIGPFSDRNSTISAIVE